ncbi:MAG: hypothetical protein EA365_13775 [Gloeocapsa sp. DLM2.Bin57]|nr:MAG: hypothetical protein EA365_13775 [Gloeocapsa sp. DLM2.Bin57]
MTTALDELRNKWSERLFSDYPSFPINKRQSIINWLLGDSPNRFNQLDSQARAIATQGLEFRYNILRKRYLNITSNVAYNRLMTRLSSVPIVNQRIRVWIDTSRDRAATVIDIIQEIIMEMLKSDKYLEKQLYWISECTLDENLRNSLLLATIEEYCLRPIANEPLIARRFINFLKREARSGITNISTQELIVVVSEETKTEDNSVRHLSDNFSQEIYQEQTQWEEIKVLRVLVTQELSTYLQEKIGSIAVDWLTLYLQGLSPEMMAKSLTLSPKKTSELREKVIYHAHNFVIKNKPELVEEWLEVSLQEHNLGLNKRQWETFYEQKLNQEQRLVIDKLKIGLTRENVAKELNLSESKLLKKWREIYLIAQEIRNSPKQKQKLG